MFVRLSIAPLFALSLLAAATVPPTTTIIVTTSPMPTTIPASWCGTGTNNGSLQCCNSVQSSDSSPASNLIALLNIVIQGGTVPIGLTCSPINIDGGGSGGWCTTQPVCCENNSYSGLIAIGCTPVTIQ